MKPDFEVELTEREKILLKAQEEADLLKQDKLIEYQRFLEKERESFETRKKETLEKLEKDLSKIGYDPSKAATVEAS